VTEASDHAYFDTSALVKRYVEEPGHLVVRRLLRSRRVVSSVLLKIEVASALRRRHAEGALSLRQFQRLLRRTERDEASWALVPMSAEVVQNARRCVLDRAVRSLDAIHIVSAQVLYTEGFRVLFVTADARQANAARAVGMEVVHIA
jgi:predicted nucleic acid-binding protein